MPIAHVDTTNNEDLTPTNDGAENDICLAYYFDENASGDSIVIPAEGFNEVYLDSPGLSHSLGLYWARRTSVAIATNWSTPGYGAERVIYSFWSGCITSGDPIDDFSFAEGSDTSIEFAQIDTTVDNCMIIGAVSDTDSNTMTSNFANERLDLGSGNAVKVFDDGLKVTAGAVTGKTATKGTNNWKAFLVALKPPTTSFGDFLELEQGTTDFLELEQSSNLVELEQTA